MPSTIVLVLGGCRSGKSSFARRYVTTKGGPKIYIATSPILDAETADRVRRHREERQHENWETREEQLNLAQIIANTPPESSLLIDCLTLWINNHIFQAEALGQLPDEDDAATWTLELVQACRKHNGLTVAVANEVGLGIVPDNTLARRFRDLAGRVNQTFAAAADEVHFLVAGLPTRIK